jgi:hypothetical protein
MLQKLIKYINVITLVLVLATYTQCHHQPNTATTRIVPTPISITQQMVQLATSKNQTLLASVLQSLQYGEIDIVMDSYDADDTDVKQFYASVLHQALLIKDMPILHALISNGINVNAADCRKYTALHWSVIRKDLVLCQFLLSQDQLDINFTNEEGNTPLHLAVLGDCLDIVRPILSHQRVNINAINNAGLTALQLAVLHNNLQIANLILEQPATDINIKGVNGCTALHLAFDRVGVYLW